MKITASCGHVRMHVCAVLLGALWCGTALAGAAEDRFAAAVAREEKVEDAGNGQQRLHRLVTDPGQQYPNVLVSEVWSAAPRAKGSVRASQRAVVADHVIVSVKAGVTLANLTARVAPLGFTVTPQPPSPIFLVRFPAPTLDAIARARAAIRALPGVDFIDEDAFSQIQVVPSDPSYGSLWGMPKIKAPQAWDLRTDATAVTVAVIDTGIDYNHQDLATNIALNSGETGIDGQGRDRRINGVDDDANGFVDDWHGWDFTYGDNNPNDVHSHGTHCSGTLGGVGNNGIGVAGVCWRTRIIPVKVLNDSGSGTTSAIIRGVDYARVMGAKVLSISIQGTGYEQAYFDAFARARAAGILAVCCAGNYTNNNDGSNPYYPASFNLDNIISVAATTSSDALASFSNYGAVSVDLAAPGVGTYSTIPGNGYGYKDGTSMATPHVAGACALLWADRTTASYAQVRGYILNNVDAVSSLSGKVATGGRLNVSKALTALRNDVPSVSVSMTAGNDWVSEYGIRAADFTISRTSSAGALTVYYTFAGAAVKGSHFSPSPDLSVTLDPGQSAKTVTITPITTSAYESQLGIQLNITANGSYSIGTGSATMTRYDQDLQLTGVIPAATYPGSVKPFNYRQVRLIGTASVVSGVVTINAQDSVVLASGASATTTVAGGATLNLTAKNLITMLPGTTISQGSAFSARIQ